MGNQEDGPAPLFAGEMRDAMRNWVTASDENRHQFQ